MSGHQKKSNQLQVYLLAKVFTQTFFKGKDEMANSISFVFELIVFMLIDLRAPWELLVTCLRSNSHRDRYYFIISFALRLIEASYSLAIFACLSSLFIRSSFATQPPHLSFDLV